MAAKKKQASGWTEDKPDYRKIGYVLAAVALVVVVGIAAFGG